MTGFEHKEQDRVSRQRAAERLIDIAYALTAGSPLELTLNGERMNVPIADQVLYARANTSTDNNFELGLELSWSMPEAERPARGAPEPLT